MSKGSPVRTFRLSTAKYRRVIEWGIEHIGSRNFSRIVTYMIDSALGDPIELDEDETTRYPNLHPVANPRPIPWKGA